MPLGSFRLNGLSKKLAPAISFANATGGTTSTYTADGKTYRVHRFNSNGTFTVTAPGAVDILLVGGGGGGEFTFSNFRGYRGASGGAANQQLAVTVSTQAYSLVVGNGGLHRDPFSSPATTPSNGGSTTGLGFTATGGASSAGEDVSGQSLGGPGAGGAATTGTGGIGFLSSITGTATYYGGGGGGASTNTSTNANGGLGGGGKGRSLSGSLNDAAADGSANTGGGGGGGGTFQGSSKVGGNGGSGVIIIRYQIA
jgi:hypothetical protein